MVNWSDLRFILETALRARLFDRLASGYVPTEAGRDAVRAAEVMEQTEIGLDRQIGARDADISGRLSITAPQLMIERVLAPVLADFVAEYPAVDPQVLATNGMVNLARRVADVALRISSKPSPTFVGQVVTKQRAAVFATPEFISRDKGGQAPLDWIRFAHWPGPPPEVIDIRPNLRVRLTVDDMMAAVGAVRTGLGATRMACVLGEAGPALARVPGIPGFAYAPIWILTHTDLRHVPRIRAFVEFTTKRLRRLRPLFEGRAMAQD